MRTGHTQSCGNCNLPDIKDCGDYLKYAISEEKFFIFDKDDLETVMSHRWFTTRGGYFVARINRQNIPFHRAIMHPPKGVCVDHINGDITDCRKTNLRFVSKTENASNMKTPKTNTCGYKGVCFVKQNNKYMAQIHPQGRMCYLGYYNTPEDAAAAYNKAALSLFGEYARLNVIGKPYVTVSAADYGNGGHSMKFI